MDCLFQGAHSFLFFLPLINCFSLILNFRRIIYTVSIISELDQYFCELLPFHFKRVIIKLMKTNLRWLNTIEKGWYLYYLHKIFFNKNNQLIFIAYQYNVQPIITMPATLYLSQNTSFLLQTNFFFNFIILFFHNSCYIRKLVTSSSKLFTSSTIENQYHLASSRLSPTLT